MSWRTSGMTGEFAGRCASCDKPCTTCFATPPLTSFDVTYCLSVRGKGLEDGQAIGEHPHRDLFPSCRETFALPLCPADVTYVFLSDPTRAQPRTIISEQMETERKGVLPLRVGENPESCETVKVYIRVCGQRWGLRELGVTSVIVRIMSNSEPGLHLPRTPSAKNHCQHFR